MAFPTLTTGDRVRVNGARYTVTQTTNLGYELEGPCGGRASIVKNIFDPAQVTLITYGHLSARSVRVEALELGW